MTAPAGEPAPEVVRCSECHRPLRLPHTRALRLGPKCRRWRARARAWNPIQDALPGL